MEKLPSAEGKPTKEKILLDLERGALRDEVSELQDRKTIEGIAAEWSSRGGEADVEKE